MKYSDLENKVTTSGMTKTAISEAMKMSRTGFNRMIKEKTYTLEAFLKLCEVLSVSPCSFLDCGSSDEISISEYQTKIDNLENIITAKDQHIQDLKASTQRLDDHISTLKQLLKRDGVDTPDKKVG